jgi:hypothetical protein
MSKDKNFYKVRGVSPTATQAQIKKAYHKKSRQHHPDKHGHDATEKMQLINHAYEILSDPESRKKYDMTGEDPSIRQPRSKQPFGSTSDSGPGYCASCDNDPCACFIFKPAGSSKPSQSHSPMTCWECHEDLAGVKHIFLSCGCCAWCSKCADREFQTHPNQTQRTLHQEIRVSFEEVQDILSRDVWHTCNIARRPICYWCKNPASDFVVGLCRNHLWCRKCFISIYIVATRDPHCCQAMVGHKIVKDHLPEPVAAYFEFKRGCKFQVWREKDQAEALMADVRDWQDKNKDLIFGEDACRILKPKDATIQDLEAKLKVSAEAQSQQAGKEASGPSTSDLKDELVRINMRIKQLQHSNNLLKQANVQEIARFSEAGKARKIATDNEAAVRKENEELRSQLATAQSQLGSQQQDIPKGEAARKGSRHNIQDELVAAQEAHKSASNSNAAAQKRLKELMGENDTLRQELGTQRQDLKFSNERNQSAQVDSNDNNAATEKKIKDLTAKNTHLRQELETQKQAITNKQAEAVIAQKADKTTSEKEAVALKQVEDLKAQLTDAAAKCLAAETSAISLRDRITWLEMGKTVPQEQRRCADCGTRPHRVAEPAGTTSSQAQPPQKGATGPPAGESKPDYQATVTDAVVSPSVESTAKTGDDEPKPDNQIPSTTTTKGAKSISDAAAPNQNIPHSSAAPAAETKPETPVSLLKAQLHYARATQKAAENMGKIAVDKYLDLCTEVRKYKKFETNVQDEFARANKMYLSLHGQYDWAMNELVQIKYYGKDATFKIPAEQFANDIDDNSKATTELLATLIQQFEPVRAKVRKSQVSKQTRKPKKMEEAPLKIAARRNRKLRDIIRQREQEIANVSIRYGQR